MSSGLRFAALALIAFAGGFLVRGLTAPEPPDETFDPASLVTSRAEADQVFLAPASLDQALVVINGERPSSSGEIALRSGRSVFVGWVFGSRGGRAIPCMPPDQHIPGCTPVDPPDTFVYCYGGEDDGPRICKEITTPKVPTLPTGPIADPAPRP